MLRQIVAVVLVVFSFAFSVSAQDQTIHIVQPGENLFRIAQQYGLDVDTIARANNITNTWRIYAGQQLIIPVPNATTQTSAPPAPTLVAPPTLLIPTVAPTTAPTAPPVQYTTVSYGQNLAQIAQNYGMTLDQIAQLNHITNPNLIYAGQRLIVTGAGAVTANLLPPTPTPSYFSSVTHIVQPGDTLTSISQEYGISPLQIAQANNIFDATSINSGEELIIPSGNVIPGAAYSFVSATAAPPARIGTGKEIIVDLSNSRVYAYVDGKLVRSVLVSTGLPGSPTVQGSFTVQRKYIAQTMTGPGYYLPDVPYVMYFYAGYALHGTYWHNNFGHPMSHGCVNLPTPEAEWFYNFTDIGTPVYVQP